jgi:hypothetical protein
MRLITKTITALLLFTGSTAFAQPVLTGNHMPDYGFSAPMYLGVNISDPGTGGNNVTWDFSWQSSFNPIGVMNYMDIDDTEFATDFLTSNLVQRRIQNGDTFYNYYTDVGSEVIINAENMGAPFYYKYPTSNTKLLFVFPMNYQDVFTDTFSSNHGGGYVRREYDGWGTLMTNFYTFHNVVRIKTTTTFYPDSTISYDWYTTDAYIPVAHYEVASEQMTILKMFPVSVENTTSATVPKTILSPNPFKEQATLYVENVIPGMKFIITNAMGQIVKQADVISNNTVLHKEGLSSGVYFYQVRSKEGVFANGKFVIE